MKFVGQITSITILMAPIFAFAMVLGAVVMEEFHTFLKNREN